MNALAEQRWSAKSLFSAFRPASLVPSTHSESGPSSHHPSIVMSAPAIGSASSADAAATDGATAAAVAASNANVAVAAPASASSSATGGASTKKRKGKKRKSGQQAMPHRRTDAHCHDRAVPARVLNDGKRSAVALAKRKHAREESNPSRPTVLSQCLCSSSAVCVCVAVRSR
jgi:hypothetical protein